MCACRTKLLRSAAAGGLLCYALLAACSTGGSGEPGGGAGGGAAQPATSSSPASSSASTAGGEAPIACDVPYTDVTGGDCDLLQQDCPSGGTCIPVQEEGQWTARCLDAVGIKGPGKACTGPAECEAGLFCIGRPNARCTSPCCPSSGAPCGNGLCNLRVNFGGAFLSMCTYNRQCELFVEGACDAGEACHVSDPQQGLATCVRAGDVQAEEGQPCAFLNECKDMQHCDAAQMGTCRYYCYLEPKGDLPPGRGGCPEGQGCVEIDFGIPGVGLCKPG